jgi:type II secretory pathway pseudopilin PulG
MRAVVAILILIVILLVVYISSNVKCVNTKSRRARVELAQLRTACRAYRADVGAFPSGSVYAVCQALSGNGWKTIPYIERYPKQDATDGTFLDPWGTPYRFNFLNPTNPVIRSAGEDRTWGTKDDIEGE